MALTRYRAYNISYVSHATLLPLCRHAVSGVVPKAALPARPDIIPASPQMFNIYEEKVHEVNWERFANDSVHRIPHGS